MNPWSQGKTQTLAVVGEKGIATEVGLLMMMDGPEKVPARIGNREANDLILIPGPSQWGLQNQCATVLP